MAHVVPSHGGDDVLKLTEEEASSYSRENQPVSRPRREAALVALYRMLPAE